MAPRLLTDFREYTGHDAARATATKEREPESGCAEHPSRAAERNAVAADFLHFLPYWKFVNRETGSVSTFASLWPGQQRAAEAMRLHRWLFLLKAGKLGFTELECAFDGWKLLYRGANTRVHLFSLNQKSAQSLLGYVHFGISHVPSWLGIPIARKTTTEFVLDAGLDDARVCVSYPAVKDVAIDQSAHHSHVDELARMEWPEDTWSSIESTIAPGGSVHILTRGAGDSNFTRDLWGKAEAGDSPLQPHFEPFDGRPRIPEGEVPEGVDPTEYWRREKESSMLPHQVNWLAPRTADEALSGSAEDAYLQPHQWAACHDPSLTPLLPGDKTPAVMGVDAGVSDDFFACVLVTRHPQRHSEAAVRNVRVWRPPEGGEVDFDGVERWIRTVCVGGCVNLHPNKRPGVPDPVSDCDACAQGNLYAPYNIVQIAYDSYQVAHMMQNLARDNIVWCNNFSQGEARMVADHDLRVSILKREFSHPDDHELNEAVRNAKAKFDPANDTKLRIVKRNPAAKVDPLVAASMAASECLRLNLGRTA